MKNNVLPLGLSFALAQDEKSMKVFSKLSDSDKKEIIQNAQNATSKSEMQFILRDLTTKW